MAKARRNVRRFRNSPSQPLEPFTLGNRRSTRVGELRRLFAAGAYWSLVGRPVAGAGPVAARASRPARAARIAGQAARSSMGGRERASEVEAAGAGRCCAGRRRPGMPIGRRRRCGARAGRSSGCGTGYRVTARGRACPLCTTSRRPPAPRSSANPARYAYLGLQRDGEHPPRPSRTISSSCAARSSRADSSAATLNIGVLPRRAPTPGILKYLNEEARRVLVQVADPQLQVITLSSDVIAASGFVVSLLAAGPADTRSGVLLR